VRDGAASVAQVIWAFGFSSRRAWRIYITRSEDLPQMQLISDKSLPVSGHLANFARYWIWARYRGRDSSRGGGLGLGRLEFLDLPSLVAGHQPETRPRSARRQGGRAPGRETARPPVRQLLAHGQGEDHDKQASDNERRNLRPTVRRASELGHGTSRRRRTPSRADEGNQGWPTCLIRPRPTRTARPECRQALQQGAAASPSQAALVVQPATSQSYGDA
jgi:hypothetical protein